jgi:hypothetical protein
MEPTKNCNRIEGKQVMPLCSIVTVMFFALQHKAFYLNSAFPINEHQG